VTQITKENRARLEKNSVYPWSFTKNGTNEAGEKIWRVGVQHPIADVAEHRHHLEQMAILLNELEASKANLEAKLTEVLKVNESLRQDLSNFSTFEQICNSGMLRNFKIDSESPFAQTILSLLQRTMELQISHLSDSLPATEGPSSEDPADTTGVQPETDSVTDGTNVTVPRLEETA
jgi:hypothetical protein